MNLEDFWIGDNVRIRSTGQLGKVEGEENEGKLKIRLRKTSEYVIVPVNDLEKEIERTPVKRIKENQQDEFNLQDSVHFNNTIDLHIEKLTDYVPTDWKADELSFQKHKCLTFLKKAIKLKVSRVVIIHGKGDGVLKNGIEEIIMKFNQTDRTSLINNGGATEVWFNYKTVA